VDNRRARKRFGFDPFQVRTGLKWHRYKRFTLRSDNRELGRHLIWLGRAGLDRAHRQGTFTCLLLEPPWSNIHTIKMIVSRKVVNFKKGHISKKGRVCSERLYFSD
jgi:hypothetical protein